MTVSSPNGIWITGGMASQKDTAVKILAGSRSIRNIALLRLPLGKAPLAVLATCVRCKRVDRSVCVFLGASATRCIVLGCPRWFLKQPSACTKKSRQTEDRRAAFSLRTVPSGRARQPDTSSDYSRNNIMSFSSKNRPASPESFAAFDTRCAYLRFAQHTSIFKRLHSELQVETVLYVQHHRIEALERV